MKKWLLKVIAEEFCCNDCYTTTHECRPATTLIVLHSGAVIGYCETCVKLCVDLERKGLHDEL